MKRSVDEIVKMYIGNNYKAKIFGNIIEVELKHQDIVQISDRLYHNHHFSLKTITATDERKDKKCFIIHYVFALAHEDFFIVLTLTLADTDHYPSLVPKIYEAMLYERKIFAFFGLIADGHPNLDRILLHSNWPKDIFPLRKDFAYNKKVPLSSEKKTFQRVEGEGMYEISVGPIHAGIIEPGHFRFNVVGEEIVMLNALLGYTHKGSEKLFEVLPMRDKVRLSERVSGDMSFTHSWAFCQALEHLSDTKVSSRAQYVRIIFSELERIANHLNDIGFIMQDTAYNFGGSQCARLREQVMRMNERICGSRHLRGVNILGGVKTDMGDGVQSELLVFINELHKSFSDVIGISENSTSMINRLEGSGILDKRIALDHGAVGIPAKACGILHDSRKEFPYSLYPEMKFEIAHEQSGDVYARFYVRVQEVLSSMEIIKQSLDKMSRSVVETIVPNKLKSHSYGIGIAEGWRGDIVYFVATDSMGEISRVDVRDPSFLNWSVVPYAVLDNVVPDFPLINKSFNLSYSGNDL